MVIQQGRVCGEHNNCRLVWELWAQNKGAHCSGTHRSELAKETNPWKEVGVAGKASPLLSSTQDIVVSPFRWEACEERPLCERYQASIGMRLTNKKFLQFLYIDLAITSKVLRIITYSAGPQKLCRILTILLKARAWARAFLAVRPFERQDRVKSLVTTFPRASSRQTHNMGMYRICLGSLSLSKRATSKITMKICSTMNVFFGWFIFHLVGDHPGALGLKLGNTALILGLAV